MIGRRRLIGTLALGGAAAVLSFRPARADRVRRIGNLMHIAESDPESSGRIAALVEALRRHGWRDGENIRIEHRWAASDPTRFRGHAEDLVALAPDVIVATTSSSVLALQRATKTLPVVFVQVIDPLGAGIVKSLARPDGNVTGFVSFEYDICAKWLQLLKEIAPDARRVAVLAERALRVGVDQYAAIEAVAASHAVELTPIDTRDAAAMERGITGFAASGGGAIIVTASPALVPRRALVIGLAARLRLPTIYPFGYYVADGGLVAYGSGWHEQYRSAAGYVDRILKGEKPGDLPVQAPTKYELVINLRAAKAIGLTFPESIMARADEVIE